MAHGLLMSDRVQRKLTTILAADAAGYSRAMDADEVGTLAHLRAARAVFEDGIARYGGRLVSTAGDGLLAEFPSVVEAVTCAVDVQQALARREAEAGPGLRFRTGVHLGDVMVDNGDLFGEGVNLASRLETMAEPGGILVSQQVFDQVKGKLPVAPEFAGRRTPKNLSEEVAVYRLGPFGPDGRTDTAGDVEFDSVHMEPQTAKSQGADPEPTVVRKVDSERKPEPGRETLAAKVAKRAGLFGIVGGGLLAMNLATDDFLWAHWPALGLATALALESVPLFVRGRQNRWSARAGVIAAALIAINLFSWADYPWAIWPVGALAMAEAIRRLHRTTR